MPVLEPIRLHAPLKSIALAAPRGAATFNDDDIESTDSLILAMMSDGMPAGVSRPGSFTWPKRSVFWMRASISRTLVRY